MKTSLTGLLGSALFVSSLPILHATEQDAVVVTATRSAITANHGREGGGQCIAEFKRKALDPKKAAGVNRWLEENWENFAGQLRAVRCLRADPHFLPVAQGLLRRTKRSSQ